MSEKEKKDFILDTLDKYYPEVSPPLAYDSTYKVLVAVLLSAQCTDKRVNEVAPILFQKADVPHKMIDLSVEEIREMIRPCGLSNNKAKAIYELSHILLKDYGGKVPNTFEDLERLPGVGHKTASVVLAQWFDIPTFPVDTHIHRLMHRWGISQGKNVVQTERDAKSYFPKQKWNKLHLQIIYFARAYCPARGHQIENCPICSKL